MGTRSLAKQGKHLGGPAPFGYTSRSRRAAELVDSGLPVDQARAQAESELSTGLLVDQKEAEIVRLIFHLYVDKLRGCRRIANRLNSLGHRRRSGRLWHPDKVRRIINDPTLAGMIPYDEQLFEAGYPSDKAVGGKSDFHPIELPLLTLLDSMSKEEVDELIRDGKLKETLQRKADELKSRYGLT